MSGRLRRWREENNSRLTSSACTLPWWAEEEQKHPHLRRIIRSTIVVMNMKEKLLSRLKGRVLIKELFQGGRTFSKLINFMTHSSTNFWFLSSISQTFVQSHARLKYKFYESAAASIGEGFINFLWIWTLDWLVDLQMGYDGTFFNHTREIKGQFSQRSVRLIAQLYMWWLEWNHHWLKN